MVRFPAVLALSILVLTAGCATTQKVSLGQTSGRQAITTVALAPSDGNSADMDDAVKSAFAALGIVPKQALPAGTRKSSDVDVVVSYADQWRWDLTMYLRWVTVDLYDARTGNLLANARWDNSAFHGFQDYRGVVKGLVDEMVVKVRAKPN